MEYDPYLDKSKSDEEISKLKEDKEANIIFARQDYQIKDGISMDLDREKSYLCISANQEFLEKGEEKLKKSIEGLQRADEKTENKVIEVIENERNQSEQCKYISKSHRKDGEVDPRPYYRKHRLPLGKVHIIADS